MSDIQDVTGFGCGTTARVAGGPGTEPEVSGNVPSRLPVVQDAGGSGTEE